MTPVAGIGIEPPAGSMIPATPDSCMTPVAGIGPAYPCGSLISNQVGYHCPTPACVKNKAEIYKVLLCHER